MMMMTALVLLMIELRSSTMLMSMMSDAGTRRSYDEARSTRSLYKQTPDRPPLAAATMFIIILLLLLIILMRFY